MVIVHGHHQCECRSPTFCLDDFLRFHAFELVHAHYRICIHLGSWLLKSYDCCPERQSHECTRAYIDLTLVSTYWITIGPNLYLYIHFRLATTLSIHSYMQARDQSKSVIIPMAAIKGCPSTHAPETDNLASKKAGGLSLYLTVPGPTYRNWIFAHCNSASVTTTAVQNHKGVLDTTSTRLPGAAHQHQFR